MNIKRRRILKITSIFLVVEAVLMYYLLMILFFVYAPGGFPGYPRYYLLPGINYILKTYYPVYYHLPLIYIGGEQSEATSKAFMEQLNAGANFMRGFQIGLIAAIIVTIAVYIIKLKSIHNSTT